MPNSPGSHQRFSLLNRFSLGIPLKYLNIMAIDTDSVNARMNFLKMQNWFSKFEFLENKAFFSNIINAKGTAKETEKEKKLDGEITLLILQKTE